MIKYIRRNKLKSRQNRGDSSIKQTESILITHECMHISTVRK